MFFAFFSHSFSCFAFFFSLFKTFLWFRSTLKDYERQGVANLLRLPFQDQQEWQQVGSQRIDDFSSNFLFFFP